MTTYTIHYIDGDHDTLEAESHTIQDGLYTLIDVASDEDRYVEVDLPVRNIFSIRREE